MAHSDFYYIQAHTEIMLAGQWHHYSALKLIRDYELFTWMGGEQIRAEWGDWKTAVYPKGLPPNITDVTKLGLESCSKKTF